MKPRILITICARKGSKGVKNKNIRPFFGSPLIVHTIRQAQEWGRADQIVVSTDSEEIAEIAKDAGANCPFLRPSRLATDRAPKIPVITHALKESEKIYGEVFDAVVDLDPTSPLRAVSDIERGWKTFVKTKAPVCFSVVPSRKNPYFNMVERDSRGRVHLVKKPASPITSRQTAPRVWELNASIYVYSRKFLLDDPISFWHVRPEIFEMPEISAFDIDSERDFMVAENLMKWSKAHESNI